MRLSTFSTCGSLLNETRPIETLDTDSEVPDMLPSDISVSPGRRLFMNTYIDSKQMEDAQ